MNFDELLLHRELLFRLFTASFVRTYIMHLSGFTSVIKSEGNSIQTKQLQTLRSQHDVNILGAQSQHIKRGNVSLKFN